MVSIAAKTASMPEFVRQGGLNSKGSTSPLVAVLIEHTTYNPGVARDRPVPDLVGRRCRCWRGLLC